MRKTWINGMGKIDSLLMLQQVVRTATTGFWMVNYVMECATFDSSARSIDCVSLFSSNTHLLKTSILDRKLEEANAGGRAVWGVPLQPLAFWDCGFESHRGHGCLSLVNVLRCQERASATGRSLVHRSPTECVSLSVMRCNNNSLYLPWLGR